MELLPCFFPTVTVWSLPGEHPSVVSQTFSGYSILFFYWKYGVIPYRLGDGDRARGHLPS